MSFTYLLASGGGIIGGMLAGHTPVGAVEIAEYPRQVLIQRQLEGLLPVFPVWDDVQTFREDNENCRWFIEYLKSIRDDLRICGGFPCTDITPVGKKAGIDGEESSLWREMARIIGEIRPASVFVENSAALVVRELDRVLGDLTLLGYNCRWGIMGGSFLGKTERKRLWLVGKSDGYRPLQVSLYSGAIFESNFRRFSKLLHSSISSVDRRIPSAGFSGVDNGLSPEMVGAISGCGMAQIPPVAGIMEMLLD